MRKILRGIFLSDNPFVIYCVGTLLSFALEARIIQARHERWGISRIILPLFVGAAEGIITTVKKRGTERIQSRVTMA